MRMGQDQRQRPGDRHKPETRRVSTKRQKKEISTSSMSSVASRPPSHSGRYKGGTRKGNWPEHAAHAAKATATPSTEPSQVAKELAETKQLLAWEQGRRLSLEGSQAEEKHMRQMLRDARWAVHKLSDAGEITGAAAKLLLQRLRP